MSLGGDEGGWQTSPRQCYAETSQGGTPATFYANFSSSIQKGTLGSICGEKHLLKVPAPAPHTLEPKGGAVGEAKGCRISIKILQYLSLTE